MRNKTVFTLLALWCLTLGMHAQFRVSGVVVNAETGKPIEFATVLFTENGLWAITDSNGAFHIKNTPKGRATLVVQCLGYQKRTLPMTILRDVPNLKLKLNEQNLKLNEVTVTARRKQDEATTSYTIDRQTLDQQQMMNVSDVATLLPGGKTTNPTLMTDTRLSLRSGGQEKGNASFGTAIEIDGMRLDNNAMSGETVGASTRTVSTSDIESIEIVTGIPSVEYGDLSNGIVKVNTRKGKSPFIVEGTLNQHTRQVSLNKGFDLGSRYGILNASMEHAQSFSDAASPHTAYERNILSLRYSNTFMTESTPLTFSIGLTGNLGGYNAEADPDNELEDYTKVRDNALRANMDAQWLLNKSWITNLSIAGSFSYNDRRQEAKTHKSSASTQPYLHATEEGYYMAELSPTGYWYETGIHDTKPMSWSLRLKADKNFQFTIRNAQFRNKLTAGVQYTGSRNNGRGTYYPDMDVAPTWREYRYDDLPTMHNLGLHAEEKLMVSTGKRSQAELTVGLRDDITMLRGSDYGTVSSLSPRINTRYIFWHGQRKQLVSELELHAGWGKSVKLPSFQVLYPQPSYTDLMVFASTSTAENTSFYAFHTYPSKAVYNPDLRWQYTNQTDLGMELTVYGTRISLSAFHHRTYRSYMSADSFTPFAYHYTGQSAAQQSGIAPENRLFSVDQGTGTITVHDASGVQSSKELPYSVKQTYNVNQYYTNATPIDRYGIEWMVDFAQIKPLRTSLRLDGNLYRYKGTDEVLFADVPLGITNVTASGQPFQYVGYYRGSNATGAGYTANASATNGTLSRQLNLNATLTTHIPKVRLVVSMRIESTLYSYRRALCEFSDGPRGYMLEEREDYFGEPYDGVTEDKFVVVYPEYYSTWEHPDERIPFAEKFIWAKENDPTLYSDLAQLVVRSNYAYMLTPNRISAYYSANLSITKEIGDHISLSFYANNFWNTMRSVHASQTDTETSLFGSSYVPSYYYGLSLRLKI